MPITIQCGDCRRQYIVDDKLAGKHVKCKGCGGVILVSSGEPEAREEASEMDYLTLAKQLEGSAAPAPSSAIEAPVVNARGDRCPMCESIVATGSVVCLSCGYNFRTKKGGAPKAIPLADNAEQEFAAKKRRPRRTGNETLAQVDGYLGLAMILVTLVGAGVWLTHLIRANPTFTASVVMPTIVVAVLLAGVVAPLMWAGIQAASHLLKFQPRYDTYNRLAIVLFLPFGVSLLCGGHEADNPLLAATVSGVWPVAALLFLYLFRGEVVESVSTAVGALVGVAVGWVMVTFLSGVIPLITGPLYVDALPQGPWSALTTEHSPVAPAPAAAKVEEKPKQVAVAPAGSEETHTVTPPSGVSPGGVAPAPGLGPEAAHGNEGVHGSETAPLPPMVVPDTPPTPPTPPAGLPPKREQDPMVIPDTGPEIKVHSPFLSEIISDPEEFRGHREVVTSLTPSAGASQWILLAKKTDSGMAVVERWSTDPLTKKGEMEFQEVPRDPNVYAISPTGEYLVSMTRFPKWQLEIGSFTGKPTRKIPIADKLDPVDRDAVPTMIGFLSPGNFMLRWDRAGQTCFQTYSCITADSYRKFVVEPSETGPNATAVSPDGHWLAILNRGMGTSKQILIYDTGTGIVSRKINPVTMDFTNLGMVFSPDSKKLGLIAGTRDVDMILTFGLLKGDTLSTFIMPEAPVGKPALARGLIWLRNSNAWIVNWSDLYDIESGRKIGSLDLPGVQGMQLIGSQSLLVQQPGDGESKRYWLAKMNDKAIQDAILKVRKK